MNPTRKPHISALLDRRLSPQAVALAATLITGGDVDELGFSPQTIDLAMWEITRNGHLVV